MNEKFIKQTTNVINFIYKNILIMLHPFTPFVTERIYQKCFDDEISIMNEK
jgi:valyl-tRNA synthetase